MKFRKLIIGVMLIIAIVTVFSISSCKKETTGETTAAETTAATETTATAETSAEVTAEEVELIIWNPTYDVIQTMTQEYIKGFKELYPNVTIKEELITWDNVYEKVAVGISTGTQPDVMWASDLWVVSNAIAGQLLFFNDLMDMPDYSKGVLKNISIGDQVFLFPQGIQGDGLVVNVDMLKELDSYSLVPKSIEQSWTIDDFMTVIVEAAEHYKSEGKYGYALTAGSEQGDQAHYNWMAGFGTDFYNDDYTKCLANSPEGIEALEVYVKMINEKLVLPGAAALTNDDAQAMFEQGKYAIAYGGQLHISEHQAVMDEGNVEPFEMLFVQAPTKQGVSPVSNSSVDGYVAFKSGDAVKEKWARKFIEYMCSDENVKKWAEVVWPIAPPKDSMLAALDKDSILLKVGYMVQYTMDKGLTAKNWNERRATMYPMLQAVFTQEKTPKQALDDWVIEVDKLLNE